MKLDRWAFALFALGVAVIMAAIFWSLYAYGEVGRMVASKGLRPQRTSSASCHGRNAARCSRRPTPSKGTLAYTPLMFWAGVAMILGSFVLQLKRRTPDEGWAPRLQRLLIPVDRVSTFVGQAFAWSHPAAHRRRRL